MLRIERRLAVFYKARRRLFVLPVLEALVDKRGIRR
jgi:hypothetical protein